MLKQYESAFVPSSHFHYIFKATQQITHHTNNHAYHCFPSDPSPLLTTQPVSCSSQLYQAVSGYENMLLPAAKPQACRTNSNNLSGLWDMSPTNTWTDTLSVNRRVVCVVKILIFASYIWVRSELKSSKQKVQQSISHWQEKQLPTCVLLSLPSS